MLFLFNNSVRAQMFTTFLKERKVLLTNQLQRGTSSLGPVTLCDGEWKEKKVSFRKHPFLFKLLSVTATAANIHCFQSSLCMPLLLHNHTSHFPARELENNLNKWRDFFKSIFLAFNETSLILSICASFKRSLEIFSCLLLITVVKYLPDDLVWTSIGWLQRLLCSDVFHQYKAGILVWIWYINLVVGLSLRWRCYLQNLLFQYVNHGLKELSRLIIGSLKFAP